MTVIIFIIVLAILVFVHELGHFLAAKSAGIRVDEFGLGFPPKIFSFKKGETLYSLNAIPFGGFVKIFGENPDDESISGPDNRRSFVHKSKLVQVYVLLAGIAFNIIFAWLLISTNLMIGMPASATDAVLPVQNAKTTITSVSPNSPAEEAQIKAGDVVTKISSNGVTLDKFSIQDLQNFTADHNNQPIALTLMRAGETVNATVTPMVLEGSERAVMGVTLDNVGILKLSFFSALWQGAIQTYHWIVGTAVGLGQFFGQIFTGNAQFGDVAGPVGIAGLVGDATRQGIVYLISFTALISINLAIINLVPFPALDGGRVLFVIIEKIKGSPIKPQIANLINSIGFLLLILLMVVITFHDIFRLIK